MKTLAVKYRPQTFEECCSQKSIITVLKKQLETKTFVNCYLFCGPSGCGKAQPLTSKVFTPNGYKLMGAIRPGDVVVDGKGNSTKVVNVFPQGERDIYRIYFNDKTFIEVADNHLNSVVIEAKDYVLSTTELLDKFNSGKSIFVDVSSVNCWEYKKTPIDPYLLGCLLEDGSIHKKSLGFTNSDPEIINSVNEILERDYHMHLRHVENYDYAIRSIDTFKYDFTYKGEHYYSGRAIQEALMQDGYPRFDPKTIIRIAQNEAVNILEKFPTLSQAISVKINKYKTVWNTFGLKKTLKLMGLNVKSKDKFIPEEYLYNSKDVRLAVLQGLMDTDGTATKAVTSKFSKNEVGGVCSISTISKQLAEDITFLARSLGFEVHTRESKRDTYTYSYKEVKETRPCSHSYTLAIRTNDDHQLFRLSRKKERICDHRFNPRRKIVDIKFDRVDQCQCIYVESPEHTYLTDNLTITHNTTLARIFSDFLNNGKGSPIEIDGASNNGVDNVKTIIDDANLRSVDSEYKVYLIDECHALSSAAWQAFLKCIEEPPKYTIFLFCTTDPQKIPATILNRVQRFNLTKIDQEEIKDRLIYVCQQENFTNYGESVDYISKICEGGMRDALALLEKAAGYSTDLNIENVLSALGNYSYDTFFDLTNNLIDGKEMDVIKTIENIYNKGNDLKLFINQYLDFVLDLSKYCILENIDVTHFPLSLEEKVKYCTGIEGNRNYFNKLVDKIFDIKNMIKLDSNVKTTIIIMLLQFIRG